MFINISNESRKANFRPLFCRTPAKGYSIGCRTRLQRVRRMISIVFHTMEIGSTEPLPAQQTTPNSIAQLTKGVISKVGMTPFFIVFLRVFYGLTKRHPDHSVKIGLS